jgi:hypothetical protein
VLAGILCGVIIAVAILVALSGTVNFTEIEISDDCTPIALLDDTLIYSYFSDMGFNIGKYVSGIQKNEDIGLIKNFHMSSGMPAVADEVVYLSVTLSGLEHILFRFDTNSNTVSEIAICSDSEPLDAISVMDNNIFILSHNLTADGIYYSTIRAYNDNSREVTVCLKQELKNNSGKVIVAFACGKDRIYAFTENVSNDVVKKYVDVYDSANFNLLTSLAVDGSPKMHNGNNGIAQMHILGDYLYCRDYSDYGTVYKIKDYNIVPVLESAKLRFAYNAKNSEDEVYLLFVRETSKYYMLNTKTDSWKEGEIPLGEQESIRNVISDGDDFCFSILDDAIEEQFTTKISYICNYTDLLKRTKRIPLQ